MIIFLYGSDTFHSRQKLNELKHEFTKKVDAGSNSINEINGQTTTLKELSEKISTGSLFVKKRLIIIENIFNNKKVSLFSELIDYLKNISHDSDNVIIFWDEELNTKNAPLKVSFKKLFTFLSKQKFVQEFAPLTNSQLLSFVKQGAKKYGKDIKLPAASLLINLTNNDVWLINQEIKKLAFREKNKTEITPETVKELVTGFFDEDIFSLTDALSIKNKGLAIKLLEEQSAAGLSDEYLLAMLIRQFKILWRIKEMLGKTPNQADIAKELRLHPFVVKKGVQQTKNFSIESLKNNLNRLIELDFLNKNGLVNLKTEFIILISGL